MNTNTQGRNSSEISNINDFSIHTSMFAVASHARPLPAFNVAHNAPLFLITLDTVASLDCRMVCEVNYLETL